MFPKDCGFTERAWDSTSVLPDVLGKEVSTHLPYITASVQTPHTHTELRSCNNLTGWLRGEWGLGGAPQKVTHEHFAAPHR